MKLQMLTVETGHPYALVMIEPPVEGKKAKIASVSLQIADHGDVANNLGINVGIKVCVEVRVQHDTMTTMTAWLAPSGKVMRRDPFPTFAGMEIPKHVGEFIDMVDDVVAQILGTIEAKGDRK